MAKSPRPDHEWWIGERADGTVDIFDESEIAAKVAEMEEAERAAKERGPAATAKRLEEEAADLEADASAKPDVKDLDEEIS